MLLYVAATNCHPQRDGSTKEIYTQGKYIMYTKEKYVFLLYCWLPDGDLLLKHAGGLKFMRNVRFYFVHMLVCINVCLSCASVSVWCDRMCSKCQVT
jgi:hypothetical protein